MLKTGEAIGFVGAGASAGLYPLWPQLIEQLADAAIRAGAAPGLKKRWLEKDALNAAQQIRTKLGPGEFGELIAKIFGPREGPDGRGFTSTHEALVQLGFRGLVTTNFDPALTRAYSAQFPHKHPKDFTWSDETRVGWWLGGTPDKGGAFPILHAHGKWDSGKDLVLGGDDYRRAYTNDQYRLLFEYLWMSQQLVVVGFSLEEPWVRVLAEQALTRAGTRESGKRRHFALRGLPVEELELLDAVRQEIEEPFHLQALFYPVTKKDHSDGSESEDHSALEEVLAELVTAVSPEKTEAPTTVSMPGSKAPQPDPLKIWFEQVRAENRKLGDHIQRPAELEMLEEAWVRVEVRSVPDEEGLPETGRRLAKGGLGESGGQEPGEKSALFGSSTTLERVLEAPVGQPAWNTGRWLLEGPPGSGKTTLLRYLAARLAERASEDQIPVFVSLPRLQDSKQELLTHATDGLNFAGAGDVAQKLAAAGREGRLVLLLDSFDEVPEERRRGILRLLRRLTEDKAWKRCRLVVSSRPIGRGDVLDELPRLELLPLEPERRREFVEKWLRADGHENWQGRAAAALEHLQSHRRLWQLSGIPLYLTLMTVLIAQDTQPPEHLAELYDEIFDTLLNGRHRPHPRPMPIQSTVREALALLAYGMTEDDRWAEPAERLEERLRDAGELCTELARYESWRHDLFAFLRDVHERTAILGPHDSSAGTAGGDWRFWHRSFREAFAAHQLWQQHGQPRALLEWAERLEEGGEGRWGEPLALLAGRLDKPDELVTQLAEANPRLATRAAVFAQGLRPETLARTLQLNESLEDREQVFENIPDQLDDPGACLALVEQLREDNRNGFDLFWLWWIVEEVERRWQPTYRSRDLLGSFFAHIPAPEDLSLLHTLDGHRDLWCRIPDGEGWIGSPEGEEGRADDEGPRHRIRIQRPFWLAAVPVTNAQYALFDAGKAPRPWDNVTAEELARHPRIDVTWYEAVSFCRWLGTLPGFEGTAPALPEEEVWEYACRANTETRFWPGDSEHHLAEAGWYDQNSGKRTHRVAGKDPNSWDLYDVHGNVWEWTRTPWDRERYRSRPPDRPYPVDPTAPPADPAGSPRVSRVVRGGSYRSAAQRCRAAFRFIGNPGGEFRSQGFRVLLSSSPSRD